MLKVFIEKYEQKSDNLIVVQLKVFEVDCFIVHTVNCYMFIYFFWFCLIVINNLVGRR